MASVVPATWAGCADGFALSLSLDGYLAVAGGTSVHVHGQFESAANERMPRCCCRRSRSLGWSRSLFISATQAAAGLSTAASNLAISACLAIARSRSQIGNYARSKLAFHRMPKPAKRLRLHPIPAEFARLDACDQVGDHGAGRHALDDDPLEVLRPRATVPGSRKVASPRHSGKAGCDRRGAGLSPRRVGSLRPRRRDEQRDRRPPPKEDGHGAKVLLSLRHGLPS